MHLGEHFRALLERLHAGGLSEDASTILNNYAVGVQRALDAGECPRCQAPLWCKRDRLLSTPKETWVTYGCPDCKLELTRIGATTWWQRLIGRR
jgi:hypothetical protein